MQVIAEIYTQIPCEVYRFSARMSLKTVKLIVKLWNMLALLQIFVFTFEGSLQKKKKIGNISCFILSAAVYHVHYWNLVMPLLIGL